jgi:WD40 repeat protein
VLVASGDLSRTVDLGFQSSGISGDGRFISAWNAEAESQGPLFDVSGPEPVAIDPPTGPIERRHAGLCDSFPGGCPGVFNSWVDFERGGADLLVQSVDSVLHLYSNHDFEQLLIEIRNVTQSFLSSPDGRRFAHGKFCPTVEDFNALTEPNACPWLGFDVVDLETGAIVFSDPEYWARSFSWSADGGRLYRITGEDEVAVWDTATWTEVDFIGGDPVGVSAIDNPLGGSYTAVTHSDGTVRLLDPTTGEEQDLISGLLETGQGSLVEFSSDGALMMSVVDSTARLWDPLSGQQIGVPMVTEVSAPRTKSGEAIQLLTETDSGIHIWYLDTSTWFDTACEAAGRNMTRAEWEQFGPRDTEYHVTCPQYPLGN